MVNKLVHLDADSETTKESFMVPNDSYEASHIATFYIVYKGIKVSTYRSYVDDYT